MHESLSSSEPSVDARGITPPPAFRVEVLPAPVGTLVLKLVGEHDLAASAGFRERVEAALAAGARNVVIDMEETTFIDSSMLKELLRANTAIADAGGRMVVTAVAAPVERLLELTRSAELLEIAPTRDAALGLVSGGAATG
jgi:stage II sporulation protein AA (anti-sigma F factor antagonist)